MGEFKQLDERDQARLKKLIQLLMPILAKGTAPVFYEVNSNRVGYKEPSIEWGVMTGTGNMYSVAAVTDILFDNLVHFCRYEFERDADHKPVPRTAPLITPTWTGNSERENCFAWINAQVVKGFHPNVYAYLQFRVKQLFKIDIDAAVAA